MYEYNSRKSMSCSFFIWNWTIYYLKYENTTNKQTRNNVKQSAVIAANGQNMQEDINSHPNNWNSLKLCLLSLLWDNYFDFDKLVLSVACKVNIIYLHIFQFFLCISAEQFLIKFIDSRYVLQLLSSLV